MVAIIVSMALWHLGAPRRLLAYSTPVVSPLVSGHWPLAPDGLLRVMLEDEPIKNPHVVILRIENRSRRDIRSTDFDQDKPLAFDLGARLIAESYDGSSASFKDAITPFRTEISVGPTLIPGGQKVRLTLVTEGAPSN